MNKNKNRWQNKKWGQDQNILTCNRESEEHVIIEVSGELTARAITPVISPVLIAVARYGDPKANSDTDGGFNPFFKCPICISTVFNKKIQTIRIYFSKFSF